MLNVIKEKTCILIDDDGDDHVFFSIALKRLPIKINCIYYLEAKVALEDLFQNKNIRPAFIFLDLNMPQLSGLECLKILKATPGLSDIPVIIYSTSSNEKDINSSKQMGALDYWVKSDNIEDLVIKLSKFFLN